MVPSYSTSIAQVVTGILLIFSIANVVALPSQFTHRLDTQNALHARAPAPGTENAHDVTITLNDKKEGKNFFKELGDFLSGFDPIDVFRTILGGLLGFEEPADPETTTTSRPWPTTSVTITPTPVEATPASMTSIIVLGSTPISGSTSIKTISSTIKTTVTKKITATKFSTKKTTASSKAVIAVPTGDQGDLFSVLPFFPPVEPLDLTGLAPTGLPTLHSAVVSKTSLVEKTLGAIPTPSIETIEDFVSIVSSTPVIEPISLNFSWSHPSAVFIPETAEASATSFVVSDLEEVEAPSLAPFTEDFASLLPFFLPGQSDNVLEPTLIGEVGPSETVEVVTTPVAPVPSETDIFSILPFIEPGENISDNVTWPTPTEVEISIPELPIPVVTVPAESLDAFDETIAISTPTATEGAIPLKTEAVDFDSLSIPLLEFVNGTYVSPTKKPHFATPVLSPPSWNFTLRPTITQSHASPILLRPSIFPILNATKSAWRTSKKKPTSTKAPRFTKPILLPPPLIRPTNFPLNQTFFANQTKGVKTSLAKSTHLITLTHSSRPTIRPLPLPKPFFNHTRSIRPIFVKPTRPLILTNPLRPTIATLKPLNISKVTRKTIKSRSTKRVTVLVIPTPVTSEAAPEFSIAEVGVPSEPTPSATGFVDPGTFPIIDVGSVSSVEVAKPTVASFFGSEATTNATVPTASLAKISVSVPSISINDTTPTLSLAGITVQVPSVVINATAPTPTLAQTSVFSSPDFIIQDVPTPNLDISSISVAISNALETPTVALSTLDIDLLFSTPTPTPRTFPTPSNALAVESPPSLPSGFPLPTPVIDTNVTFPPSAKRLAQYCADPEIKSVTLPLLQKWYGPNAYPSLRPYPGCVPANPRQALQAPGLLNCTALGKEVQACQKAGKRVLLGVKVDGPSAVNGDLKYGAPNILGLKFPLVLPPGPFLGRPGHPLVPLAGNLTTIVLNGKTVPAPNLFDTVHSPASLAATLFSLFGEGHAERADLRPLGPDTPSAASPDSIRWVVKPLGEEVVVDGFDIRTPGQWKGTTQADLVNDFVGFLREKTLDAWNKSGGKKGGPNDLGIDGPGVVVSGYI